MIENSRKHKRFSLDLQVKIMAESRTGVTPLLEFVTANISTGGAYLKTETPLPIASKVHLEFLLSLEDVQKLHFVLSLDSLRAYKDKRVWVKASGIVIRVDKKGMAIIFDENYQILPMEPPDSAAQVLK